jgi:biopolymer transport protein ExbD
MRVRRPRTPAPHIPFISLADIAWQIIIFFFLATSFAGGNFSLNVPMPSSSTAVEQALPKTINVKAGENAVTVNGVPLAPSQLESYVASLLTGVAKEEDRAVILFPDEDLSFQRTAESLYAIQKAGGIAVISEERRDDAGPTK